jgi:ribosomal protein S18 acetylase RimI-like enzyme
MQIRRLGPGDEEVARRVAELFARPDSAADGWGHLPALLADEHTHLLVAFADGAPVGVAQAHELPRLDGPRAKMLLYALDVAPAYRRRGIGRALVAATLTLCRARRCRSLWLVTNESNAAAMALYQAAGGSCAAADDVVVAWETPPT